MHWILCVCVIVVTFTTIYHLLSDLIEEMFPSGSRLCRVRSSWSSPGTALLENRFRCTVCWGFLFVCLFVWFLVTCRKDCPHIVSQHQLSLLFFACLSVGWSVVLLYTQISSHISLSLTSTPFVSNVSFPFYKNAQYWFLVFLLLNMYFAMTNHSRVWDKIIVFGIFDRREGKNVKSGKTRFPWRENRE